MERRQRPSGRRALVLSAGMMFGAYQAGVWKALAGVFSPDLVVGVSSGALNAWAIAGGCPPDELAARWLDPSFAAVARLRFPCPPWKGVFDPRPLAVTAQRLCSAFRPRIDIGVAVTQIPAMRPRLFQNEEITWQCLLASCSIPLGFPPVAIDGCCYVDGGFLGALPLWGAAAMGADGAVAIHALPRLPSFAGRAFLSGVRLVAPPLPEVPRGFEVHTITPSRPMGSLRDLMFWRRENIERWIELGHKDGESFLNRPAARNRAI